MNEVDSSLDSTLVSENPSIHEAAKLLKEISQYDFFEDLKTKLRTLNPEITDIEKLYSELTKKGQIQSLIFDELSCKAEYFYNLSQNLRIASIDSDKKKLNNFSEANSLAEAFSFSRDFDEYLDLFEMFESKDLELLQCAITCQLAGFNKNAKVVYRQFTKNLFINENPFFYYLLTNTAEDFGSHSAKSKAGKKGNEQRHATNRKVKDTAVKLYLDGNFKNPSQASKKLLTQVKTIGLELGSTVNWDLNGEKLIYKWLSEYKKTIKSQNLK